MDHHNHTQIYFTPENICAIIRIRNSFHSIQFQVGLVYQPTNLLTMTVRHMQRKIRIY